MAKMKLKVAKSGHMNPRTKAMGYSARVVTNGTAALDDIVAEACHNTTMHKAEAKVALELCMEAAAEMLRQGYIVDLGVMGRFYPSCVSGWAPRAEDLQLERIVPSIFYRPAREMDEAVKGATLQWAKEGGAHED